MIRRFLLAIGALLGIITYALTTPTQAKASGDSGISARYDTCTTMAGVGGWAWDFSGPDPDIDWSWVDFHSMVKTKDGDLVMVGHWRPKDDALVMKVDSQGNMKSVFEIGGPLSDTFDKIIQTSDGGYAITGLTYSYGSQHHDGDLWLVKLDSNLKIQWQKRYWTSDTDQVVAFRQAADGGYVILGNFSAFDYGPDFLLRLDEIGNIQWCKSHEMVATAMELATDGGCLLSGVDEYGESAYAIKVDGTGTTQWTDKVANSKFGGLGMQDLRLSGANTYLWAGYTNGFGDSTNAWVVQLDASGNVLRQLRYKGSSDSKVYKIDQCPDGGWLLGGMGRNHWTGTRYFRLDKNLKCIWMQDYDQGIQIMPENTLADVNGFVILGNEFGGLDQHLGRFLFRLDTGGNMSVACHPIKRSVPTLATKATFTHESIDLSDVVFKQMSMSGKLVPLTTIKRYPLACN